MKKTLTIRLFLLCFYLMFCSCEQKVKMDTGSQENTSSSDKQSESFGTQQSSYNEPKSTPIPTPEAEITRHFFWYDGNQERVSGLGWSGKSCFVFFVSVTGPESKVNSLSSYSEYDSYVELEKIIRLWWTNEDKEYWDIRETTCQQFPCKDDNGEYFYSPLKEYPHLAIGDKFTTSSKNLSSNDLAPISIEARDYFKRYDFDYWK